MTRGERNIRWIEAHCRIPEGKLVGKRVKLTDEQCGWVKQIYDTPTRTFILSMARKNAKTTFCAFLLLLHIAGPEAKPNSQLYSAAQSRDQASILFALAAKVVRQSPDLLQYINVRDSVKELHCGELGTLYKALSADAATAYGLSPAFSVHDELGQVRGPRSELYEAIETASAAQESPLSLIISTQAPTDGDLLSILIDDALRGEDPRVKVVLYSAPMSADPFSDEAIRAANPHFDAFMNKEEVRRQAFEAKRMPSREASYRNLILNQRVNASNPFISAGVWRDAFLEYTASDLAGLPCCGGLDLSSTTDTTAFVLAFSMEDGIRLLPFFWLPADGMEEKAKKDRVPYDLWRDQGFLRTTPGRAIDHMMVLREVAEISSEFNVQEIAYDRWAMNFVKPQMDREQLVLPLVEFGQGYQSMSPALKTFESEILNGKLFHPGHPVLTSHAANAVATQDPAGNRKLDKSKATGRIDGLVSSVMAVSRVHQLAPKGDPEFFFL